MWNRPGNSSSKTDKGVRDRLSLNLLSSTMPSRSTRQCRGERGGLGEEQNKHVFESSMVGNTHPKGLRFQTVENVCPAIVSGNNHAEDAHESEVSRALDREGNEPQKTVLLSRSAAGVVTGPRYFRLEDGDQEDAYAEEPRPVVDSVLPNMSQEDPGHERPSGEGTEVEKVSLTAASWNLGSTSERLRLFSGMSLSVMS